MDKWGGSVLLGYPVHPLDLYTYHPHCYHLFSGMPQMTGGYLSRSAIQQHTAYDTSLSQYSLGNYRCLLPAPRV